MIKCLLLEQGEDSKSANKQSDKQKRAKGAWLGGRSSLILAQGKINPSLTSASVSY